MGYSHDSEFPFAAFVTNLGKYNEGELVGEWVKFPTTPEKLQEVFEHIGIGSADEFGQPYEEWFITDYDCYVDGLYDLLGEYENLDELNYLASKLEELNSYGYEQFQAAMEISDYTGSLKDLINLTDNLDKYDVFPDIEDYDDLGRYYIDEMGLEVPGYLQNYIDYEAYGRDIALEEVGAFTDHGYVRDNQDRFVEYYDGDRENIPEEYRVMVSPEEVEEVDLELERLEVSTDLALDLDLHFRGYSADYVQAFPKEQVQREAIADALMEGKTSPIKTGLLNMSREMDLREETAPLIGRLTDYEKEFGINTYTVYQLKDIEELHPYRFEGSEFLAAAGLSVDRANYEAVYAAPLTPGENLETIFIDLNYYRPDNFRGHSLSVSDVVVLQEYGKETAHFCDRFGYKEVPEFLEPENYLKAAEVQVEDDYGMIDGIINNGERAKDKEPDTDKPSVLGRLSQAKKECAERKPPEIGETGKDGPEL